MSRRDASYALVGRDEAKESELRLRATVESTVLRDTIHEADLTTDSYGLFMLRVVQFSDLRWGRHAGDDASRWSAQDLKQAMKVIHAIAIYATSVILEMTLTFFFFIKADMMESTVESAHFLEEFNISMGETSSALEKACANSTNLIEVNPQMNHGEILKRCGEQIQVHFDWFYPLMIFIWFMMLTQELRLAFTWLEHLWRMPVTTVQNEELIQEDAKGIGSNIVRLPPRLKVIFLLLNPSMRLLIMALVGYSGAKFLFLQTSEFRLFLKALCMKFVVEIDEMALKGFSSPTIIKELSKSKMLYHRAELETMAKGENTWWNSGVGGFFYYLLALVFLCTLELLVFGGLARFRRACRCYNGVFPIAGVPEPLSIAGIIDFLFD